MISIIKLPWEMSQKCGMILGKGWFGPISSTYNSNMVTKKIKQDTTKVVTSSGCMFTWTIFKTNCILVGTLYYIYCYTKLQ